MNVDRTDISSSVRPTSSHFAPPLVTGSRCVIIGAGRLALECARRLRDRSFVVTRLVTGDAAIRNDAIALGFPVATDPQCIADLVRRENCDFLFSVVNDIRIAPETIQRAGIAAINYHDGPLPRYAGLHATSWAILNGERAHGVCWTLMNERLDGGDVLVSRTVEVGRDESAFELNGRCFIAALDAFDELVTRILSGRLDPSPQDLTARTYFGRRDRPGRAAIIDWNESSEHIIRLVRALDLGGYDNPLGSARLWLGDQMVLIRSAAAASGVVAASRRCGELLAADERSVTVATRDGAVTLTQMTTFSGEPISPAAKRTLATGTVLPTIDGVAMAQLVALERVAAIGESRAIESLQHSNPFRLKIPRRSSSVSPSWSSVTIDLDSAHLEPRATGDDAAAPAIALIAAFLGRIADGDPIDLAARDERNEDWSAAAVALLDPWRVLNVRVTLSCTLREVSDLVRDEWSLARCSPPLVRDVLARRTVLQSAGCSLPSAWPTAVRVAEVDQSSRDQNDAELMWTVAPDGRRVRLDWRCDVFAPGAIERLIEWFNCFRSSAGADPDREIGTVEVMSGGERELVLKRFAVRDDAYEHGIALIRRFEEQARRAPDRLAIIDGPVALSYGELNHRANRMALRLRVEGVGRESVVAIALDRSAARIVATLAVWKAGGAWLPLDTSGPAIRTESMLRDARASAIIGAGDARLPEGWIGSRIDPNDESNLECIASGDDLDEVISPDDLACVIFTSGSTGEPKGVLLEHRAIANNALWMQDQFQLGPRDRVLHKTSFLFDVALNETIWPLIAGAAVVLAPWNAEREPDQLVEIIRSHRITIIHFVPSMLRLFVEASGIEDLDSLRLVMTGAEALRASLRDRCISRLGVELVNFYGPTEAAVGVTSWRCELREEDDAPPPIGFVMPGCRIRILDSNGQPVPIGIPGEIHIGGVPLARGYANRSDETAARFIPDRFVASPTSTDHDARLYRTGDLGRWRADGAIEFVGRRDHQIKLRGFRIELSEVEAALEAAPGVSRAIVRMRDSGSESARIEAIIEPGRDEGSAPPEPHELRRFLSGRLHEWMIPSSFMMVEQFPLNVSGKVDRIAIDAWPMRPLRDERALTPPRSPIEAALLRLWEELLGQRCIGVTDSFFNAGGHSLLGLRLIDEIHRRFDADLPASALFRTPTIAGLAQLIDGRAAPGEWSALVQIRASGARPPIFMIHPIEGTVLDFADLARLLGDDQPVYALQSPGLDGDRPLYETVEEIADHELRLVRRIQPHGPYSLLGRCFGGLIAYEMARRLRAEGEAVSFLGLLDTYRAPRAAGATGVGRRGRHLLELTSCAATARPAAAVRLVGRWRRLRRRAFERLRRLSLTPRELRAALVWKANSTARRRYEPGMYDGPLTLLLTRDVSWIPEYIATHITDSPEAMATRIVDYWRELARGGVELIPLAGTHQTALREPHVAALAAHLRERLEANHYG